MFSAVTLVNLPQKEMMETSRITKSIGYKHPVLPPSTGKLIPLM